MSYWRGALYGWVIPGSGLFDGEGTSLTVKLCLAQDDEADRLLSENPFALLVGMLLDQQVPMETAFSGPKRSPIG
jgi:hypothetical protein